MDLGPDGLEIPHVLLTDMDPRDDKPPRARSRIVNLLHVIDTDDEFEDLDDEKLFRYASENGYFVNDSTLEWELYGAGLGKAMVTVLVQELGISRRRRKAFRNQIITQGGVDEERLLRRIERVGKGRFAQSLCGHVSKKVCPEYSRKALERIRNAVS